MMNRLVFFVCLLFLFSVVNAQTVPATLPTIQLVWMGANDCPPCVAWRKDELPKLRASEDFKAITFSYVIKTIGSPVPSSFFLPADVKPLKDKLDYAGSGRRGSPQAALIVNGEVFDYFRNTRTALEIQAMIDSVRNNTAYPFKQCLKVSITGGKCEITG